MSLPHPVREEGEFHFARLSPKPYPEREKQVMEDAGYMHVHTCHPLNGLLNLDVFLRPGGPVYTCDGCGEEHVVPLH